MVNNILWSNKNPNLPCGQALVSHNGRVRFVAQDDGNLCIYAVVGPGGQCRYIWGSGTNGQALSHVCMGSNGEVAAFKPNSADTVWKSGSWNSGQQGPFLLMLQDDGDLCVYCDEGGRIWQLGTKVSPEPIKFSSIRFIHQAGLVLQCPLIKDWSGDNDLWNEQGGYWAMKKGDVKTINLDEDTVEGDKCISELIGHKIGGSGTICALGVNVVWGTNKWVDPLRDTQFVYEKGCKTLVEIVAYSDHVIYNGSSPLFN